jgi:Ca-activated chloride channel family protein
MRGRRVTFQWPEAIACALVVPAFLWFYIRLEQQRSAAARRHASLYSHSTGLAVHRQFVRHIPLMLFLASLLALSFALARPQAVMTMFAVKGTVVLVLDVSTSMKANDALPSRLARSQVVAKEFVAKYSDEFKIGLVSLGGNAVAELDPATGREELFAAIDRLAVRPGTAIGSGITTALAMIFPEADIDALAWDSGRDIARRGGSNEARMRALRAGSAPASYSAAAIVLISDGESAGGPDPITAAHLAADLGVRIHTVGVGSAEGRTLRLDGWTMRVRLDEAALKEIATLTHGEYFSARTGIGWPRILESIRPEAPRPETYTEITALFAAAAALVAVAGALASLVWTKRIL